MPKIAQQAPTTNGSTPFGGDWVGKWVGRVESGEKGSKVVT